MRRRQAYAQYRLPDPETLKEILGKAEFQCEKCGKSMRNDHGLKIHSARCKG